MSTTTKATRTPGPWELIHNCDGDYWIFPEDLSAPLAITWDRSNAILIAAAPDLLEVLETIENDDKQVPDWLWKRIQLVIRKAKREL